MMFQPFKRLFTPPAKKAASQKQGKRVLVKGGSRMYSSAKQTSTTLGWTRGLEHIDYVIKHKHRVLVARSRDAYSDNGTIVRFVRMMLRNLIGDTGFKLQVKHPDENVNRTIEALFKRWSRKGNCDVTGGLSFQMVCESVVRSWLIDGEAFVLEYDTRAGFQLEVLDAQRCPSSLVWESADKQTRIVNGIEYDEFNRPVAYYFMRSHAPREAYLNYLSPSHYDRIDASRVHHVFLREYVGQRRGIPALAAILIVK